MWLGRPRIVPAIVSVFQFWSHRFLFFQQLPAAFASQCSSDSLILSYWLLAFDCAATKMQSSASVQFFLVLALLCFPSFCSFFSGWLQWCFTDRMMSLRWFPSLARLERSRPDKLTALTLSGVTIWRARTRARILNWWKFSTNRT